MFSSRPANMVTVAISGELSLWLHSDCRVIIDYLGILLKKCSQGNHILLLHVLSGTSALKYQRTR